MNINEFPPRTIDPRWFSHGCPECGGQVYRDSFGGRIVCKNGHTLAHVKMVGEILMDSVEKSCKEEISWKIKFENMLEDMSVTREVVARTLGIARSTLYEYLKDEGKTEEMVKTFIASVDNRSLTLMAKKHRGQQKQ